MRRLLAVTALLTMLSGAAGCSTGGTGDGAGPAAAGTPPGPTGMPASSGVTASNGVTGGNATQVCAAAQEASTTAVRTYVAELGQMLAAVGAGDSRTAEAARGRAEAALAKWRTVLREQSERTDDPQLNTLLTDLGTEVSALGADVESIDETELDRLQQRLDQLCAR
ncbi:hypothetical protein GAR05_01077 [Micromonospora saelicesensis]|uniref:Secreted protein n=1 Tax=Micromonospora saelicesensis TaxID=285676 RepID=A0ABX9CNI3_9ACTN|nr:hypothetical protein [Micromonospora saelicesensis]RAO03164.1 hypothetical protein GAR05_01077 [Micromonospora saelicesensis]RAO52391.1 hypothetical protein LUPAC06_05697 [Micromonospora saelicesensis]